MTGKATSAEARASMQDRAMTDRDRVLWALRTCGPLTADECATLLGWKDNPYRARRRVSELAQSGLIEDSGEVRANASGRNATVWRIATKKPQTQATMFETELRGDILPRRRTR